MCATEECDLLRSHVILYISPNHQQRHKQDIPDRATSMEIFISRSLDYLSSVAGETGLRQGAIRAEGTRNPSGSSGVCNQNTPATLERLYYSGATEWYRPRGSHGDIRTR